MEDKLFPYRCTKRTTKETTTPPPPPKWSDLHTGLLEMILRHLAFSDILRFKAVCSSWNFAAKSYTFAPYYTPYPQFPWLMLPSRPQDVANSTLHFFSLPEKKMYTKKLFQHFADAWCVGSSHGWLVVFDNMSIPHLLNPITGEIFRLPSMSSMAQSFDKRSVLKAILSSHPLGQDNKKVSIVVMYAATLPNNVNLAFYERVQEGKWTELDGQYINYCDVMFHNAQLYAITRNPGTLEVWDFRNSIPIKTMHIRPAVNKINSAPKQGYLVESLGEILRVEKFRDIYKMNSTGNKWGWEKVECLGGNQSMSFLARDLPGCQENSIYFTPSHPQNNGYRTALGVYSLKGKVVESIYVIDHSNRYQPPFFIVPHPQLFGAL